MVYSYFFLENLYKILCFDVEIICFFYSEIYPITKCITITNDLKLLRNGKVEIYDIP